MISFMKVKCVGGHTCPPMLFMRKMNMAMTTDLTSCGTSSEITVKRTPNHVSAGKAKKIESTHFKTNKMFKSSDLSQRVFEVTEKLRRKLSIFFSTAGLEK